jgi:hypothetical protein
LKKLVIAALKIGISVGILAYLVIQAHSNEVFSDLAERPKDWTLLAAATGLYVVAMLITFVRWWYLVRALGMEFSLREAVRLGLLGFLFNLAPMGIVGGDVLKAVLLARQQPAHRAESLVTVFVDRVIGLYVLFLVASLAALATGLWRLPVASVQITCKTLWALSALGTVAIAVPLAPDLTRGKSTELVGRIPYVGPPLKRIVVAVRMYRLKLPVLLGCSLMTVAVHTLFVLVVYDICVGLYSPHPTLGTHFVVVPASSATAVLPISFGPFEAMLDMLYADIPFPDGGPMVAGQGLVVALGYRMITVLIAAVGLCYYLASRREVAEGIHEAELEGISE